MSVLDGKVAIVTGAGRGLGRVEALELARLGARVVVNDLGTKGDGSGKDEEPARQVVEEINKAGGEAVAHFGDVADWNDSKSMFETAISEFGDVNILVNSSLLERAPDVVEFLKKYSTTVDDNNEFLAKMEEMDWEADETAIWFLKDKEEIWTEWVSSDIQDKVKNALAAL